MLLNWTGLKFCRLVKSLSRLLQICIVSTLSDDTCFLLQKRYSRSIVKTWYKEKWQRTVSTFTVTLLHVFSVFECCSCWFSIFQTDFYAPYRKIGGHTVLPLPVCPSAHTYRENLNIFPLLLN